MGGTSRAFSKEGAVDHDVVAAALHPKFTVATGPEQTSSHTWLDTFDWRLHAAGLSLQFADGGPLVLQLPDGTRLQAPLAGLKWPAQAHELPAGPLREALTPLIAPRALAPVVTVRSASQEARVLDAEDKTVARLLTESVDDGTSQLRIQPLRGYDADGDRIARLLAKVEGFTAVSTTPYDLALTHAARSPANGGNAVAPLQSETLAVVAIAQMLSGFAAVIDENVPGTIASVDIEFLHDLRVAVRRTRSILKLVGDVLPAQLAERFAPDFKWLGDLTTPVRDLDVYLFDFDVMAARLTSASPGDLDPFRSFLVKHRTAERRKLVRGLRSKRFHDLLGDWRAELDEVSANAEGGPTVAGLARRRLRQAYRNAARRGKRISEDSPSDDVHALRKRCKELRYLLEVFKPVCDSTPHRALLKELKSLQDILGDFQDGEVQREAVHEFAAAMMEQGAAPPTTLLAMGEMAAQLDAHQLNARAALASRLQPFLADENRSRVKALVRR
ncbi:CHAD domain-containing protein [Candidatus Mycobacterium wuenschmannii]|uniref:CHAD domain-containing protein n=1 Tax=Candidatus Mycobacterium wuenschmannii TaxID=3027808 RepID=A0ABY8W1U8_9MYCO|nr:CHAD domain-containing protein [Candidatus Mycobacterium wuenschmannii]WIM89336.1 CHAD domain-containing protein [Candidatus Mycobacterium wuenschmannii]